MFKSQLLKQRLMNLSNESFESLAIDVFLFQYHNNKVYRQFVDLINKNPQGISSLSEIPCIPIQFFKNFKVSSTDAHEIKIYESSGTTDTTPSRHYVYDEMFYFEVAKKIFNDAYGDLKDYTILGLLPNYLERNNSSLVAMVDHFMKYSKEGSGFYLNNFDELSIKIKELTAVGEKLILWGVTFALIDFVSLYSFDLQNNIVLETGGMKGRKKEMVRKEVHDFLEQRLCVRGIHAEYGMTELFSQAYSSGRGIYKEPFSMKILLREVNDPFTYVDKGKRGGVNVIDLANIDTCSFIATQDLGMKHSEDTFEILGRFDESDLRGCNLMVG